MLALRAFRLSSHFITTRNQFRSGRRRRSMPRSRPFLLTTSSVNRTTGLHLFHVTYRFARQRACGYPTSTAVVPSVSGHGPRHWGCFNRLLQRRCRVIQRRRSAPACVPLCMLAGVRGVYTGPCRHSSMSRIISYSYLASEHTLHRRITVQRRLASPNVTARQYATSRDALFVPSRCPNEQQVACT